MLGDGDDESSANAVAAGRLLPARGVVSAAAAPDTDDALVAVAMMSVDAVVVDLVVNDEMTLPEVRGGDSHLTGRGTKMHPGLSQRVIAGGAERHPRHIGSSRVVCARGGAGGGGTGVILLLGCGINQFNVIGRVNYRRWCGGIVRKRLFWEIRVVIKHNHKITKYAFLCLCAHAYFIAKTQSQTPRPLYHWKAETVSFLQI